MSNFSPNGDHGPALLILCMKKPEASETGADDFFERYDGLARYARAKEIFKRTDLTLLCDKDKIRTLKSLPKHWEAQQKAVAGFLKENEPRTPKHRGRKRVARPQEDTDPADAQSSGSGLRVYYHSTTGEEMAENVCLSYARTVCLGPAK